MKLIPTELYDLPSIPGVYKIYNIVNGFHYYGSAGKQGLRKRLLTHYYDLVKHKHHSYLLQNDWNKYLYNDFEVDILLQTSNIELVKQEEQKLLDFGVGIKHCSYNILDKVDYSTLPQQIRQKITTSLRNQRTMWSTNRSGFRGVCYYKRNSQWKASLYRNNKSYHIGYYDTPEEAYKSYLQIASLSEENFNTWWFQEKLKRDKQEWNKGEKAPGAKLTNQQVLDLIYLWKTGEYSQGQLAKQFGISQSAISNIVRGKRRKL